MKSLLSILGLAVLLASTACKAPPETPRATALTPEEIDIFRCTDCNVVLISIDTLRADRMSVYGYERETTPHLEAWAKEGLVFDRFLYNGGGTLPSHMSMLTSLHPSTHQIGPEGQTRLPDEWRTLAQELKDGGYATGGFTDAGWMRAIFGFDRGFDAFDSTGGHLEMIFPRAIEWLEGLGEEPFFLFLHSYDAHSASIQLPYDCPAEFREAFTEGIEVDFDGCRDGHCATRYLASVNRRVVAGEGEISDFVSDEEVRYINALYDGCVRHVDQRLSDFFGYLRSIGKYENTLIIVVSDHGEELGEHGRFLHDGGGYEEYAHIPLQIRIPNAKIYDQRVPHLAAMVDLVPTVLDVVGLPIPEQAQGTSLMKAVLRDQPQRPDVHMYNVLYRDGWKFFRDGSRLYNLETDPLEQTDLSRVEADKARKLNGRVNGLLERDRRHRERFLSPDDVKSQESITLTEEEIENLRALGYLQ